MREITGDYRDTFTHRRGVMQKALVVLLSAGQLCAGAAAGQDWAAGSPAHSIDPCYQALSCSLAAFLGALQDPRGDGSNWTAELLSGLGRVDNTPCFRTKEHTQRPGGFRAEGRLVWPKKREFNNRAAGRLPVTLRV